MNRRVVSVDSLPALRGALFVQPHCDDAVLSSFGLLARAVSGTVVTVFAGVPGLDTPRRSGGTVPPGITPHGWMTARRTEDSEALARFHVGVVHLDFLELQFRDDPDETGLVGDITRAVREQCSASVTAIVAPLGIGGNPNHLQVAAAVRSVSLETGVPVVWCADYPYAARPSWPAWVEGNGALPGEWAERFEALGAGGHDCTVAVLTTVEQRAKIDAFSVYASQVAATEKGDEHAVSDPSHLRIETYLSPSGVMAGG
ncbi:MAG: PIG-L deacetylase family protein [Actinomycetota bacterium]